MRIIVMWLALIMLAGCGSDDASKDGGQEDFVETPDPVDPDPVDPDPVDPDPVDPDPSVLIFDEGRLNQTILG